MGTTVGNPMMPNLQREWPGGENSQIWLNPGKSKIENGGVESFCLMKQIVSNVCNLMVGCVPLGNDRNKSPGCANPD